MQSVRVFSEGAWLKNANESKGSNMRTKKSACGFQKGKNYLENELKLNVGLNVHVNGENKLN